MCNVSIVMLGTGCPWPDLERSGPAQVLLIDEKPMLIDCGEGTTRQLMKAGIAPHAVDYLWITHLHADHVLGYGQFLLGRWFKSRRKLTLVGPAGTKKFHNRILEMYEEDINYKLSLGRSPEGLLDTEVIEVEDSGAIFSDISVKVTAERMIHNVPTFAYRFQVGNTAVVFSGDTAPTDTLVHLARNADVLVHDCCLAPNEVYSQTVNQERKKIWEELQKEHCSPSQAADTAREAGVKQLILTHFLPNTDVVQTYQAAKERFAGSIIVPNDLQVIPVSIGVQVQNN